MGQDSEPDKLAIASCDNWRELKSKPTTLGRFSEFNDFIYHFYCAIREEHYNDSKEWIYRSIYIDSIRFPLIYRGNDLGQSVTETYTRDNFKAWVISAGDGTEQQPFIDKKEDRATVSIWFDGTSVSHIWYFEKKGGQWMLIKVGGSR